jgi:glycosyltransferase involved in cell wall biosynthesis
MPARLPRISIVVPSYNHGHFLRDALDSIFRQDYPELEVVVMDGGSTDGSVGVIESYAPRLKYWQSRPDGGQSAAINAGVRHCTGDLVAWLNSDDYYWGDALWTVGRAYAGHPGRGLYVGNGFRRDQRTGRLAPFCSRHVAFNREALLHGTDFVLQPATFLLREAWEAVGGLDPELHFCMDWDLFLRVASRHPAVVINEYLAVSREYDETKTRSGKTERAFEIIRMVRKHTGREATPGGLMFLLETLLDVTRDEAPEDLGSHLAGGLECVARYASLRWGNGHGFPAQNDPQDRVYLPLAAADDQPPGPADGPALPSVSIVIPTDRPSPLVDQTLASIAGQRYADVESLVIDGDATDRPTRFCQRNRGVTRAITEGLRRARGEIVAWMHPGDLLTAGALRAVGRAFADDAGLELVYANALHIDADGRFQVTGIESWGSGFWTGELPEPGGLLPHRRAGLAVPQATVFFRRRVLERCGPLNAALPAAYGEYEYLTRLAGVARVGKLERTQALCRAREVDTAGWWAAWYRETRRRWPAVVSSRFPGVLRAYVADYLRRKFPAVPRGAGFWIAATLAALSATTRLGNPERWRPPPPLFPRAPVGHAGSGVVRIDPLSARVRQALRRRTTPYHSLVCGPSVPRPGGGPGAEAHEYQILNALARLSLLQFFAYDSSEPDSQRRSAPACLEVVHTPALLEQFRPDLISAPDRRSTLRTGIATRLRRRGLPVPGPRCPLSVTRQFRPVRAYCRRALEEAIARYSPDFLFVTPQTNPLALTLETKGRNTRLILIAHAIEGQRMRELAAGRRGLSRLALKWEADRAARFERENLARYDGVIAFSERDRRLLVGAYGFPAERVLVVGEAEAAAEVAAHHAARGDVPGLADWLAHLTRLPRRGEQSAGAARARAA